MNCFHSPFAVASAKTAPLRLNDLGVLAKTTPIAAVDNAACHKGLIRGAKVAMQG
jgi:hypothetical protein